jgi:hypothetical protein
LIFRGIGQDRTGPEVELNWWPRYFAMKAMSDFYLTINRGGYTYNTMSYVRANATASALDISWHWTRPDWTGIWYNNQPVGGCISGR